MVDIHRLTNNNWSQVGQSIVGEDEEEAGYSVARSNDGRISAIGAPGAGGMNRLNSGIARVFQLNQDDMWVLLVSLQPFRWKNIALRT